MNPEQRLLIVSLDATGKQNPKRATHEFKCEYYPNQVTHWFTMMRNRAVRIEGGQAVYLDIEINFLENTAEEIRVHVSEIFPLLGSIIARLWLRQDQFRIEQVTINMDRVSVWSQAPEYINSSEGHYALMSILRGDPDPMFLE